MQPVKNTANPPITTLCYAKQACGIVLFKSSLPAVGLGLSVNSFGGSVSISAQFEPYGLMNIEAFDNLKSVSYTHLTLPTIYSV